MWLARQEPDFQYSFHKRLEFVGDCFQRLLDIPPNLNCSQCGNLQNPPLSLCLHIGLEDLESQYKHF